MKVSIITPSFNSAKTIKETLESVLIQDYQDMEHIVIDGGSTDKTMDIIKKFKDRISRLISEPDKGIYDAMNKGIRMATGEIIGILNSDDVYVSDDVISKVVRIMEETGADCLWADLIYINENGKVIRKWNSSQYREGFFQKGWHPPHSTFFVRKSIYDRFGLFNTSLSIAADYELMLRFLEKHRVKSHYIPETLVRMRAGGKSNKNILNIMKANIECYRAWKMNGLKINPLKIFLKPLSKIDQYLIKP